MPRGSLQYVREKVAERCTKLFGRNLERSLCSQCRRRAGYSIARESAYGSRPLVHFLRRPRGEPFLERTSTSVGSGARRPARLLLHRPASASFDTLPDVAVRFARCRRPGSPVQPTDARSHSRRQRIKPPQDQFAVRTRNRRLRIFSTGSTVDISRREPRPDSLAADVKKWRRRLRWKSAEFDIRRQSASGICSKSKRGRPPASSPGFSS